MERGNEWSVRVAATVGQRVAYYRRWHDMTASMLSQRCATLGLPLDRNVIAKLETGHRRSVTVDELYVLAAALGVPPSLLLAGVGMDDTAEILPGRHVPPFRAVQWIAGEGPLPQEEEVLHPLGWTSDQARVLTLYREHDRAVAEFLGASQTAHELSALLAGATTEAQRAALKVAVQSQERIARQFADIARGLREECARQGWEPPRVTVPGFGAEADA